jgi:gamma-glutamyltranspeptidase / glutathione hydrolase
LYLKFVHHIITKLEDGQQPQGHVQVLLNMLRGFTPQAALDAPRFCISVEEPDSESSSAGGVNSEVYFEDGFSKETIAKLRGWHYFQIYFLLINLGIDMGHDARVVTGFNRMLMGRGQVIQKLQDPSGRFVWAAGSDPRGDGHAAAQI